MVELISYDSLTNQIVALVQKDGEQTLVGRGAFTSPNQWNMKDVNLQGDFIMNVWFSFVNQSSLIVEGTLPNSTTLWKVKYIKHNSMKKNIGIQLVSVKEAMLANPSETLEQLGKIGYNFIETFVYDNRKFYDMSPKEFKALVEKNGMKFTGSMTFKDLPQDGNWESTMDWWRNCIDDHVEAGVEYLTTSNNEIHKITSIKDLKLYCDYYNAIGKLCHERGIQFGLHNHAEEFKKVDGITIYDYFLENTDPKIVRFQSDLYWMKIGGVNPIDYFKKYPGRFFSWHVKDNQEVGASGTVNFNEIFEYAQKAGLQYNLVEVENYNYAPIKSVELSYNYLINIEFAK